MAISSESSSARAKLIEKDVKEILAMPHDVQLEVIQNLVWREIWKERMSSPESSL